ncbi:MAG: hypothetical protein AB7O73_00960 [Bacteroidia bacterium]
MNFKIFTISLSFAFLVLLPNYLFSQSNKTLRIQAENAMLEKDWYSAAVFYGKLIARDSSKTEVNYEYANASRLNFDLDIADYWYTKIIETDKGKKYPLTFFYKAQILQHKQDYKQAKKWYTKFSRSSRAKKAKYKYYREKSLVQIEACDLAQILIANPLPIKIEHLDSIINSKVSEYAAFEKDSTLYFSSLRSKDKYDENQTPINTIYQSHEDTTGWEKIKKLDTNINATYVHNANITFDESGNKMIISRCSNKNSTEYACELFQSEKEGEKWKPMLALPEPINLKGTSNSQPNLCQIGDTTYLFFASNRGGGQGGYDIWYSILEKSGTYASPVNAGTLVNTPDDEITPWFVSDQRVLYFSSTYHAGLGGFDIFRSTLTDSGFTKPVNAGYPINSPFNDIHYSVNKQHTFAYVSSNRIGSYFEHKLNCCNDIYRFPVEPKEKPLPPIDTVQLLKGQMKVLVPLTLYFHNDEPDPKTKAITTKKNYEKTYTDYKALKPQYLKEYSSGLEKDDKTESMERIEEFFADSVDVGMNELARFAKLLKEVLLKNEQVKITMKGYCSPLASTDYNVNLAKRRISSLRNYFLEYENGYFMKYINNQNPGEGSITFEDVDIGELPKSKVSDDLKDKKNSVYSPFAARERKIQIIAISFLE